MRKFYEEPEIMIDKFTVDEVIALDVGSTGDLDDNGGGNEDTTQFGW